MPEVSQFKAEFFKALAHPLRIRILDELRRGEVGVNELCLRLDAEQAPVSPQTIADAIQTFIRGKESENLSSATIRKLRYQLNMFEQFMTSRSKFYPADITAQDVIDYRATWTWSDLTKIKAQSNLRGFIQACCKGNHRTDLP